MHTYRFTGERDFYHLGECLSQGDEIELSEYAYRLHDAYFEPVDETDADSNADADADADTESDDANPEDVDICGAEMSDGDICERPADECPYHGTDSDSDAEE